MIPLRDTIPSRRTPCVTILLILLNTVVFINQFFMTPRVMRGYIVDNGFIPVRLTQEIQSAQSIHAAITHIPLLTGMFLHGSWLHLISNMWILWLFGDNVEDRMGPLRYLLFYLMTGYAAGMAHYLSNPASSIPAVGASGAIAGVMGAYFILYPQAKIITLVPIFVLPLLLPIPAVIYLFIWFIGQVYSGLIHSLAGQSVSGIAWWAHIGGFVAGILLHPLLIKKRIRRSFV